MPWTYDDAACLKVLWANGLSGSEIAAILDKSRNAVLGKAHRLGLQRPKKAKRNKPTQAQRRWKGGSASKRKAPTMPETTENARSHPPECAEPDRPSLTSFPPGGDPALSYNGEPIGLMELTNTTCRWPVSETPEGEHLFCGAPAPASWKRPYCAFHEPLAHGDTRTPEQRKRDKAKAERARRNLPKPSRARLGLDELDYEAEEAV